MNQIMNHETVYSYLTRNTNFNISLAGLFTVPLPDSNILIHESFSEQFQTNPSVTEDCLSKV